MSRFGRALSAFALGAMLSAGIASAQSNGWAEISNGWGELQTASGGGSGTVTTTGSPAAGSCVLWSGATSITADAGCSWTGTGATFSMAASKFTGPVTALKSATTSVDVSAATAPSASQVLTATNSTHATWQTPATFTGALGANSLTGTGTANRIGTATTADALADTLIATSATTQKGLVIQGKAGQTGNLFEVQGSTGAVAAAIVPGTIAHLGVNTATPTVPAEIVGDGLSLTDGAVLRLRNTTNSISAYDYVEGGYTNGGGAFVQQWYLGQGGSGGAGITLYSTVPVSMYGSGSIRMTLDSVGVTIPSATPIRWSTDTGLSRTAAATVALGNGTAGDATGMLTLTNVAGPGTTTTLTESTPTGFATLTFGASEAISAEFLVRVKAADATDFQSLTSRVRVSSIRKATGNTITTVSAQGTTAGEITAGGLLAESAGASTLVCTYTATEGASAATVNASCVSSLTQTVLNISFLAESVGPVVIAKL